MKKSLKEILAPMSNRQRVEYIWGYYKGIIIGVLAVLLIVVFIIYESSNKVETGFSVTMIANQVNQENLESLNEVLNEALIEERDRKSVKVHIQTLPYRINESGFQMDPAYVQKLFAEIAAAAMDVLILPVEQFESWNEEQYFLNIAEVYDIEAEAFEEQDLLYSPDGTYVTGINLTAINGFRSVVNDDSLVMTIAINSENKELASEFFKVVMD